jgi:hypothetical protein
VQIEALVDVLQIPFRARFYDSLMDFVDPGVDSLSALVTLCKQTPPMTSGAARVGNALALERSADGVQACLWVECGCPWRSTVRRPWVSEPHSRDLMRGWRVR